MVSKESLLSNSVLSNFYSMLFVIWKSFIYTEVNALVVTKSWYLSGLAFTWFSLNRLKRSWVEFWNFSKTKSPRKKCPYSELFWSVFCPNAGKCGPEQLRIRTLFTVLFTSSLHNQMQLTFDENVRYIQKSVCFSQNKCSVN